MHTEGRDRHGRPRSAPPQGYGAQPTRSGGAASSRVNPCAAHVRRTGVSPSPPFGITSPHSPRAAPSQTRTMSNRCAGHAATSRRASSLSGARGAPDAERHAHGTPGGGEGRSEVGAHQFLHRSRASLARGHVPISSNGGFMGGIGSGGARQGAGRKRIAGVVRDRFGRVAKRCACGGVASPSAATCRACFLVRPGDHVAPVSPGGDDTDANVGGA